VNIGEFLQRKGPMGIPYWGLGAMGAAVVGGVVYLNSTGALGGLTSALGGEAGGGGAGGGSGAGSALPPDVIIPANNVGPLGGVPGIAPAAPTSQSSTGIAPSDPLLVGQQSGATDGGLSVVSTIPTPSLPVPPPPVSTPSGGVPTSIVAALISQGWDPGSIPGFRTPLDNTVGGRYVPSQTSIVAALTAKGVDPGSIPGFTSPVQPSDYLTPPKPAATPPPAIVAASIARGTDPGSIPGFTTPVQPSNYLTPAKPPPPASTPAGSGVTAIGGYVQTSAAKLAQPATLAPIIAAARAQPKILSTPVPTIQLNTVQSAAKSRRTSGTQIV
jgi:hypothetical protein